MEFKKTFVSNTLGCLQFGSAIALSLLPLSALALSVGSIEVQSHLNQSLAAQIPLDNFGDLDKTQIKISLAENTFFAKAGLTRATWLNDITFKVVQNPDDTGYILLSTQDAVKDPIVDLLINISWPTGKMVRQYTILLDPSDASVSKPKGYLTYPNNTKVSGHFVNTPDASNPYGFGLTYGPIQDNDSLWKIAQKMVVDTDFTASQAVLAIHQKNPEAFSDGNMNQLRRGATLNLPLKEEIAQSSAREAGDQIAASPNPPLNQGQKTSLKSGQQKSGISQTIQDSKPLKILSPSDIAFSKKKSLENFESDNSFTQNPSEIDQKLALLEEELDTVKRQKEVISEQNSALKEKNNQLLQDLRAEVQKTLSGPSADTAVTHSVQEKIAHSDRPLSNPEQQVSTPTQGKQHKLLETPAHAAQVQNRPTSLTAPGSMTLPNDGLSPMIHPAAQTYWGWILSTLGLLGLATLGGVAFLAKEKEGIMTSFRSVAHTDNREEFRQADSSTPSGVQNYGLDFDMEKMLSDMDMSQSDALETDHKEHLNAQLEYEAVKQKFQDKLDEAELLFAYEKYKESEEVLITILKAAENHWLAFLKLLELYVVTNQYPAFYKWYQKLPKQLNHIVPEIWAKINFLLEKVEHDELYQANHSQSATHADFQDASIVTAEEKTERVGAVNDILSQNTEQTSSPSLLAESRSASIEMDLNDFSQSEFENINQDEEDFNEFLAPILESSSEGPKSRSEINNQITQDDTDVSSSLLPTSDESRSLSETLPEVETFSSDMQFASQSESQAEMPTSQEDDLNKPLEFILHDKTAIHGDKETVHNRVAASDTDSTSANGLEFKLEPSEKAADAQLGEDSELRQCGPDFDSTSSVMDEEFNQGFLSDAHSEGDASYQDLEMAPRSKADVLLSEPSYSDSGSDVLMPAVEEIEMIPVQEASDKNSDSLDILLRQSIHESSFEGAEQADLEHPFSNMSPTASAERSNGDDVRYPVPEEHESISGEIPNFLEDISASPIAEDNKSSCQDTRAHIDVEPQPAISASPDVIDLSMSLSEIDNLAKLLDDTPSIELARAFILAGELNSAKSLLKQISKSTQDPRQVQVIQSILERI